MDHKATPVTPTAKKSIAPSKLGKIRLAFLYILIGSLAASALTAITGLVIGEFNEVIQKALVTIFTIFAHSLFILGIVVADRHNLLGKAILPTTIGALALLSLLTTSLGTWEVISVEMSWRLFGLYFFVIAAAFTAVGALKLFVNQVAVKALVFSSVALIVLLTIAIIPWALDLFGELNSLYYRIVAAIGILLVTVTLIALIVRTIVIAHNPALKATRLPANPFSGGMLAYYITTGAIASIVAMSGLTVFIVQAVQSGYPDYMSSENRYDDFYR